MIYVENSLNNSHDAAFALAEEEFLLENYTVGEYLMLWISPPTVVYGKFQNPFEEFSLRLTKEAGIAAVRRNSGGGCVYHDSGNLNFTVITDKSNSFPDYERFLSPIAEVLRSLGVPACLGNSFDITVDGKKVSGNAEAVSKNRMMHHGTLLFDSDLSVLSSVTGNARTGVISKSIKSNPAPVANIRPYLKDDMDIYEFAAEIRLALCREKIRPVIFDNAELSEISRIAEKYRSFEWNFARSPAFCVEHEDTIGEKRVKFVLNSKNGLITSLTSDYDEINDILASAIGIRLTTEELKNAFPDAISAVIEKMVFA